jgi:hypothetical protein
MWPAISHGNVDHIQMEVSPTFGPGYPELVEQIIAAGYRAQPRAPVQVCSIQSLKSRLDELAPPDLLEADARPDPDHVHRGIELDAGAPEALSAEAPLNPQPKTLGLHGA